MKIDPSQVKIEVAAQNGKPQRLVIAKYGDTEHRDEFNTNTAKGREAFIKGLAKKLNCDADDLQLVDTRISSVADQVDAKAEAEVAAYIEAHGDRDRLLADMPEQVKIEAKQLLDDPDLIARISDDIAALGVAGETELALTIYLIGTSRIMPKTLAAIIQGPSSSGKSFTIEQVAKLFPPEAVVHATQMTPQALFHMPEGALAHRFVVAGERSRKENDDTAEATRALREMLSAGRLVKLMPMKVGGNIRTVPIEQDGPISYVESTTLSSIFEEDRNRCILLNTDERPAQTQRIITTLAEGYSGGRKNAIAEQVIARHHALQRMIEAKDVIIPFAQKVGELIDHQRVEVRRAYPHLMNMVQVIAILHQAQRQVDHDGSIIATEDDYKIARHLLDKPLARLLGNALSDPVRRFYDRLTAWVGSTTFTTTDARQRETASRSSVAGWVKELHEAGLLDEVEASKGNKAARYRIAEGDADDLGGPRLPTLQQVFGK